MAVEEYLEGLFKATREGLSSQYGHEQLHHLWDRLGCRFAIEYLCSPVAVMEQERHDTKRELNKISSMVKLLMRQLEEQREEITKGMAQVRELKEEWSGKDAAGDEAGRQSPQLHAEEDSFAPASSTPTFLSGQEEGNVVLKWARENGCPWDEQTCAAASRNGHLPVLQWARENGCPWDERACASAANRGHLDVLQWAKSNGCPS